MNAQEIGDYAGAFCFGYPFVMAWYWMIGGVLYTFIRERHEPPVDEPPETERYTPVSILLPCHNEEANAEETIGVLAELDYPDFEIIAINDGSTDRTRAILDELATRIPRLRVVHLAQNQGKSTALNFGAMAASHQILVGTDGDALLDRHSLKWMVRRLQNDAGLGGVTGNPRIRNRATLLGRLQVGEFSSIVGMIKRTQFVYGSLFTVSGVMCAFRKRALQDAGWWAPGTLTDDVDISWRMQLAGWRIAYEPKAICWILMPETLKGLWRQRLRWAQGGSATAFSSFKAIFVRRRWGMLVIWLNFMAGICWAYVAVIGIVLGAVNWTAKIFESELSFFRPLPETWPAILAITYFLQALVSVVIDSRYEPRLMRSFFWLVWYPFAFWLIQAFTAVVAVPKALLRPSGGRGVWVSPDRGFR